MIELAEAGRAWWLVLGALILVLAVPPRPQRELLTAHLPQWRAALRRCRRSPLRFPWLRALLLLLAFTGAVLAFCRPQRPARPGPTRLCVLIDASASLAATVDGRRVYDELEDRLQAGLATLPPHVRAATRAVRCGRDVRFLDSLDHLGQLAAPDAHALGMRLAEVAAHVGDADTALWTLTDGHADLPDAGALSVVGRAADNVALCALRVDDRWPLPDVAVQVEVANFSGTVRTVGLRVAGDAEVFAEVPVPAPVVLAAGERGVVAFEARRRRGGALRIEIADAGGSDALALDDHVVCVLPPPPAPRIAVLSRDGGRGRSPTPPAEKGGATEPRLPDGDAPILRWAAEALAGETGGEVVDAGGPDARADFVLVEGGTQRAADWREGRGLLFGTTLQGDAALAPTAGRSDAAVEWARDDPLTAGLDFSELRLSEEPVAIGGEVLVSAGGRPLLAVRSGRRVVQCAFRLGGANLWLLPAFPQLLRRAYAAAHAELATVRLDPTNLVAPDESDLRRWPGPGRERPLPQFGAPARDLTAWFALAALACLLARAALTRAP